LECLGFITFIWATIERFSCTCRVWADLGLRRYVICGTSRKK
jgi:hypothetical protein